MIVPIMLAETTRRMRRAFSSSETWVLAIAGELSRSVKFAIVFPLSGQALWRALTHTILVVYYKNVTKTTACATACRAVRRYRHPDDRQTGPAQRPRPTADRRTRRRARSRGSGSRHARHRAD